MLSKNLFLGLGILGVAAVLSQRSFATENMEIPFRDVAVDNMTERHRSIITAEMKYGGIPDVTNIDVIKMITGTPIQNKYDSGVTL